MANVEQKPEPKGWIVIYNNHPATIGNLQRAAAGIIESSTLEVGVNLVRLADWQAMKSKPVIVAHLKKPAQRLLPSQESARLKSLEEGPTLPDGFAGAKEDQAIEIVRGGETGGGNGGILVVAILRDLLDGAHPANNGTDEKRPRVRQAIREQIDHLLKHGRKEAAPAA